MSAAETSWWSKIYTLPNVRITVAEQLASERSMWNITALQPTAWLGLSRRILLVSLSHGKDDHLSENCRISYTYSENNFTLLSCLFTCSIANKKQLILRSHGAVLSKLGWGMNLCLGSTEHTGRQAKRINRRFASCPLPTTAPIRWRNAVVRPQAFLYWSCRTDVYLAVMHAGRLDDTAVIEHF